MNLGNRIDPHIHVGETHGIFKITDVLDEKDKYGHYIYVAECTECGYKKYSHYGGISGEKSKSYTCNHLALEGGYIKQVRWSNHRIQNIFNGMKSRCYCEDDKAYRWYGAKEIKICDEWLDNPKLFEDWSLQNGYDDSLTIDRIDEDKDYSPNNCRWITLEQNSKYKSTTSLIEVNEDKHTGRDWAEILGIGTNIINTYIRKYGLENTIEFIKKFMKEPKRSRKSKQSYYDLYMS